MSEGGPLRNAERASLREDGDLAEVAEAMTKSTIVGSAAPENCV